MLIDSHVHLQDKKFTRDLERVLERAEDAGIERLVCVGDKIDSSRKAVAMARNHGRIKASIGVHPHHEATFTPVTLLEMERLARDPAVVAIGEIGLDYHYPNFSRERQIENFVAQAHLAQRHNLPIVIHCRDAYDELLGIIRNDSKIPRRGAVHCFSGNAQQARAFLDEGYYLGIGGAITYPNGDPLREAVARVGVERLICETDAPYLPPQCKRGRRNEPSYLKHTVKALADLLGLSYQDVARVTKANAIRLFELDEAIEPKIAYRICRTLYLCITNRCPNECYFCERCHDYMVMGHFLKLDDEPTAEELIQGIDDVAQYGEVVLSGLGEPTMRWDVCLETARRLKELNARVRLNTNGLGSLINGRDIVPEMAGRFDAVSINLVAHNEALYNRIARPDWPDRAWDAMLEFVRGCKQVVPDVILTVVAVPEVDVEACRALAEDELKVRFRVREYQPKGYAQDGCEAHCA